MFLKVSAVRENLCCHVRSESKYVREKVLCRELTNASVYIVLYVVSITSQNCRKTWLALVLTSDNNKPVINNIIINLHFCRTYVSILQLHGTGVKPTWCGFITARNVSFNSVHIRHYQHFSGRLDTVAECCFGKMQPYRFLY